MIITITIISKQKFSFPNQIVLCDQILHGAAILDKMLKTLIFNLFKFVSSLIQNVFHFNIRLGRGFPATPYLLNFLNF